MKDFITDAISKGLIEVIRKPRSEKLAELIRTTKSYAGDFWAWYEFEWNNRN